MSSMKEVPQLGFEGCRAILITYTIIIVISMLNYFFNF